MKKQFYSVILFLLLIVPAVSVSAQDIEVISEDSVVYGTPGDELILYAYAKNISSVDQVVFVVRTENEIPGDWTSSLCFGDLCFPPNLDSVATDPGFGLEPIPPGDTVEVSVHFFTSEVAGTGHVQIQIGTAHNPNDRTTINYTASTEPSAVNDENYQLNDFKVYQNYPNPFNPSTVIAYQIPQRSDVNLKVYDITGREVASLVNEVQEPGSYRINFNAEKLSSGIYFYKVTAGKFTSVNKMILIK